MHVGAAARRWARTGPPRVTSTGCLSAARCRGRGVTVLSPSGGPDDPPAGKSKAKAVRLAAQTEADGAGSVQADVYAPCCVDGDHVMTPWTG